jgi:hypothetical protein
MASLGIRPISSATTAWSMYFRASDGRPLSLDFTRDGETLEIAGRYAVAFNEGSACVVATVAGLGILQDARTFH